MEYIAAVDIGAGESTKLALCRDPLTLSGYRELPVSAYGSNFEAYCTGLAREIEALLKEAGANRSGLRGIGVATAGILASDGRFLRTSNIAMLEGHNIREWLRQRFDVPVGIANDADAGGLAEWAVLQVELLYWVFGGGWGGSWISRDGTVRFPSTDWNGDDRTLHPTNEPGFSIPLSKEILRDLFPEVGASYRRFEENLLEEFSGDAGVLTGPAGSPDTIRAEVILSGPGRLRLFHAIVGDNDGYESWFDADERGGMADPAMAGRLISKLSRMRVDYALNTDRLYGKVLAHATRVMVRRATEDGLPPGVPICLGGKPSYALPYFGPSTQRFLGKFGLLNYLRPSVIDERGLNANIVGAAVVGEQAAARS